MDDLISEFLTETNESLDELDLDLVNLEQNPNDKDLLGKIFRLMHTIKGTCGFLSLPRLEKVAHHAENVLGRFRDGDLEVTPEYVTLIFESIDRIKYIVGEIADTGGEPAGNDADIIARLDAVFEGTDIGVRADKGATSGQAALDAAVEEIKAAQATKGTLDGALDIKIHEKTDLPPGEVSLEELEAAFAAAPGMDGIVNAADLVDNAPTETFNPAPRVPRAEKKAIVADQGGGSGAKASQTLRVSVDVLEDLMNMVSELVLTRNQLLQIVRAEGDTPFTVPLQRLNHVVSDLQEGVMKTRMQPIGNAWSKLPRIIRDLGIELGKKLELEMRGQDTELDRQVLEMIKDPLTHMVRNSGDHGIEMPAERVAAGKPEMGRIILEAFHEGGHIIIKISDDGKGLSEQKIRAKILQNGLASAEELEGMSTQQIQQFIFKAGFSTAEAVTAVSGRGVGMDVVRTNIEKIGGAIELISVEGKGSTFTIKIPLTLAIVSALIVEAAGERFAIPQLSVRELVMVSEHSENKVEYIKGAPVFRLRNRLLPLVLLNELLGLENVCAEIAQELIGRIDGEEVDIKVANRLSKGMENHAGGALSESVACVKNLYIVIAEVGGYEFGIIVDRVFDTEEIVVKPVAQMLKNLSLFSGNTILGDGSVIMILDPNGIANSTGNLDTADSADADQRANVFTSATDRKTSLLLFKVGDGAPKAVPLSLVARLENVRMESIERSGGQMIVQYRGTLMPLIPFNGSVQMSERAEKPVLVFADKTHSMGIIVDEIVDIMDEHINVQLSSQESGIMGSAIINGEATDVVDIAHFLNHVNREWFKDHDDVPFGEQLDGDARVTRKKVLLVDDSPFFRNMLTPILSVAGYDVSTAEGPTDALEMSEKGLRFDLIISDIEMPDMNGFDFAQHVKGSDHYWAQTPMIAMSSHARPQDMERGLSVGFEQYIVKFDKDTLLRALSQTIG